MMIFDIVSMCLRNLLRRKIRTLLTIVGVVVGTCAIVVMISLGLGMNASQEALLAQMGDLTIIEVFICWICAITSSLRTTSLPFLLFP